MDTLKTSACEVISSASVRRRDVWRCSYTTLTRETETLIREFMGKAKLAVDPFDRSLYHDWAFGAWQLWMRLTPGRWPTSDYERLRELLEFK